MAEAAINPNVPLVSVVMPVYNAGGHLPETVESILGQSLGDLELMVVDDASTDGSWEILRRYAERDRRIRLERHPENRGHRAASNRAMELSRGKYVARTDQDDVSDPRRLAAQVAFLEEHPEVGLLASSYVRLFPDGRTLRRDPPTSHEHIRWRLLFGMIFCHSTLMFRRESMRPYRFAPAAYDYEISARLARETRVACLDEPLVVYRMHERGMSTTQRGPMETSVAAISAREIRRLLAPRRLERTEIESLRRLASGKGLAHEDLQATPLLGELFDRFARLPDIGPAGLATVRSAWLGRLVRDVPARHLSRLLTDGALRRLLLNHPAVATRSALTQLPRRAVRSLLPRSRSVS